MAKIVVADGNAKMRLLTVRLLETKADWRITEAVDGYDAIVKVGKIKPDLVVLDFAMPGLNGFQTAHKIASHFPNIPIVLYTFYGFSGMKNEAQKHGISDVVDKTASGDHLIETVERFLSKASSPSPTFSEPVTNPRDEEEPQNPN